MKRTQELKEKSQEKKRKKKIKEIQRKKFITKSRNGIDLLQKQAIIGEKPDKTNGKKKQLSTKPSENIQIKAERKKDKKIREKSKKSKKIQVARKKYGSLTDKERFQLGLQNFKQNLNGLSQKYGVPEYLIIDLLMMTIQKVIPFTYRKYNREYNQYMNELTSNLCIKLELNSSQEVELENLIHDVEKIFEDFEFDLFKQFSKGRNSKDCYWFEKASLLIVYEEFKEIIDENISNCIESLNIDQKAIFFLLSFWMSKRKNGNDRTLCREDLTYIRKLIKFYSKKDVDINFIINILVRSSIGHFDFRHYYPASDIGEIFYFWREIPAIKKILGETELPDFSEDIINFKQKFDIYKDKRNLLQYIALDSCNDKGVISETIFDKITIQGTSKIVDFPKIIHSPDVNPFLINEFKEIVEEIKTKLNQQFSWLVEYIKTNLNGFLYDENRYGKVFYIKLGIEEIYIEIYPWYNEFFETSEWKENYNRKRFIIILYHPNFRFLNEELYDSSAIIGVLAFGDNKTNVLITTQSQKEKIAQLLELIQGHQFQLNFLSKPEVQEHKQVIHTIPLIDDFWFFIDFEKNDLEHLQAVLSSKSPLALLLIAKNEKMSLEDTLQNLFTDEYIRKIGGIEADVEPKSISQTDITTTILSSEKLKNPDKRIEIERTLNALSAEIDKSSYEGKKLLIFKVSFSEFQEYKKHIESLENYTRKKGISTVKIKLDFEELKKDIQIEKLISSLCWIYSIPSFKWNIDSYISTEFHNFIDFDLIRAELEQIQRNSCQSLPQKNAKIMERSWNKEGLEHRQIKVPAYNTLLNYIKKEYNLDEDSIKIEKRYEPPDMENISDYYIHGEPFKDSTGKNPIPDLYAQDKVWVEIETLRGHSNVILHIYDKLKPKFEEIKRFKELWIVIPNLEYFFHKKDIVSLRNQLTKEFQAIEILVKFFGVDYYNKNLILIRYD